MTNQFKIHRLSLGSIWLLPAVLGGICGAQDPSNIGVANEAFTSCSLQVTTNRYEGPNSWGTVTVKNAGTQSVTGLVVEFDVPGGAHCTNDAVPSGATLSPLTGTGPSATTPSSHCKFTWESTTLRAGASKTFNYSTDSTDFSAASNVGATSPSCGATAQPDLPPPPPPAPNAPGGTGTSDPVCVGTPLQWHKANLTKFESYPAPGSRECIAYSGCHWEGQFSALDAKQPKSWVKANNIVAVHSKDFAKYKLKTLRLKQGPKQIDVKVYDACADSDCSGCCTRTSKETGFLIDIESYTAARFGASDGIVDWACVDCP